MANPAGETVLVRMVAQATLYADDADTTVSPFERPGNIGAFEMVTPDEASRLVALGVAYLVVATLFGALDVVIDGLDITPSIGLLPASVVGATIDWGDGSPPSVAVEIAGHVFTSFHSYVLAGTYVVTATLSSGAQLTRNVTVVRKLPTITSATPLTLNEEDDAVELVVTGTRLFEGTKIVLNGIEIAATHVSDTELRGMIDPANYVGGGLVIVRVDDGFNESATHAEVLITPAVLSIEAVEPSLILQSAGPVMLTLHGTGFTADMRIAYNNVVVDVAPTFLERHIADFLFDPSGYTVPVTVSVRPRNSTGISATAVALSIS